MAYLPRGAVKEEKVVEQPTTPPPPYKPKKLEIPKEFLADAPANSKSVPNSVPKFVPQETNKVDKGIHLEACWKHLRSERDKLLKATDYVNTGVIPLNLEERAQLYNYRKELRELPNRQGAPWTPDTIPWPTRPQTR